MTFRNTKNSAATTIGDGPRNVRLEKSVLKVNTVDCGAFYGRRRGRQYRRVTSLQWPLCTFIHFIHSFDHSRQHTVGTRS